MTAIEIMDKFDALIRDLRAQIQAERDAQTVHVLSGRDWRDGLKPGDWVIIRDGSKYQIQRRDSKKLFIDYRCHDNGEITCGYGLLTYENITARWEPPKCPELPYGFEFYDGLIMYADGENKPLEKPVEKWIDFFDETDVEKNQFRAIKLWQDTWGKLEK